jgi:hypothetical protein
MMYEGDWRVDPDGRDTEDRKNGPVTEYKLTPEEIEKLLKGAKKMTETVANYEVKGTEKKRMTKVVLKCDYGSSTFDTKEFTTLIEGILDLLAEMDIHPDDEGCQRDARKGHDSRSDRGAF